MAKHLLREIPDLISIAPLQIFSKPFKQKHTLYTKVLRDNYLWELEPVLHECLSAEVERHLRKLGDIDCIVSPGCFPYPNVFLNTTVPVIVWADATLKGLTQVHPGYKGLCAENFWCADGLQREMLDRANQVVFSSDWAANSAIADYKTDSRKVHVVPFGANLHSTIPDEQTLEHILGKRSRRTCKLIIVGSQWKQKGGEFALAVLRGVLAAGIDAKLYVAGSQPGTALDDLTKYVTISPPFIKDSGPSEACYTELLSSMHFLLHPSAGDCYGITMCEANSWAVPVLARKTGGAGTIIEDGQNGFLFSPGTSSSEYASKIVELFSARSLYDELCRTAWAHYKDRLNWTTSAQRIRQLIEDL